MPYIGNTVQNQGFAPAIDYFSGNGVTVTFTLSRPIASVAQVIVAIDNVIQNPSSSFTVAGNSITFTSAPLSGTNNIWVEYTSLITTYAAISQDPTVIGDIRATGGYLAEGDFGNSYIDGTIVDYVTGNARITTGPIDNMTFYHGGTSARSEMMELYYVGGAKIYGTTALTIPVGTTVQRPTGATGMIRYNTTTNVVETYNGSDWVAVGDQTNVYTVSYLIVAGGGAGSGDRGGGGGAGGYQAGTTGFTAGTTYSVVVGAGGAANSGNGSNSSITGLTASVGGGGGVTFANGNSGGSGGGAGYTGGGGSGTAGQGNNGGAAFNNGGLVGTGGGGGGASASGANAGNNFGGGGGNGTASSISGSSVTYAGGGGGSCDNRAFGSAGAGGAGGGGNGGAPNSNGSPGSANTGGGGGGGSGGIPAMSGGNGGSGIVIISYPGAQRGTGGTVTSSGGNTIHTFTTSGTYTA